MMPGVSVKSVPEHRAEVTRHESELGIQPTEAGAAPARRTEWWRAVVVAKTTIP